MKIDDDTKHFIKLRLENNAPEVEDLSPIELREMRASMAAVPPEHQVQIDNIKDMTNILVLFKTGISYSTENMFVAILLIKRLYNSSGNLITSAGDSGNIIVGTASDGNSNTTDSFFDGSIGYSWSRATYDTTDASGNIYYGGEVRAEDDVLKNLNGQFLDTNITEGVDDVVGVSYHMAFKPLHGQNNILNINSPKDTSNKTPGEPDRSNVATIITLIPY